MALTAKQEAFAQGLADGLSQAAAYRAVYETDNMLASTVVEEASRLAANPNVSAMARELKAALAAAVTTAAAWTLDRQVEESAVNLAGARGDRQWAAANGALTTIGKLTGVLIDRHEVSGHVGHSLRRLRGPLRASCGLLEASLMQLWPGVSTNGADAHGLAIATASA
jgi:hypothetical protein